MDLLEFLLQSVAPSILQETMHVIDLLEVDECGRPIQAVRSDFIDLLDLRAPVIFMLGTSSLGV